MITFLKELDEDEILFVRDIFALYKGKQLPDKVLKSLRTICEGNSFITKIGDTFRLFEAPPVINGLYKIEYATATLYYIVVSVSDKKLAFCYCLF